MPQDLAYDEFNFSHVDTPTGYLISNSSLGTIGGFKQYPIQTWINQFNQLNLYFPTSTMERLLLQRDALYCVNIAGIDFFVQNYKAHKALESIISHIATPHPNTAHIVADLARIRQTGLNVALLGQDLTPYTYLYGYGNSKILLPATNHLFVPDMLHQWNHATLPLLAPSANGNFTPKMREALFSDYWDYNTLTPTQQTIAEPIFYKPQERLPVTIQGMAEKDLATRRVAPKCYNVVQDYVEQRIRVLKPQGPVQHPIKIWDIRDTDWTLLSPPTKRAHVDLQLPHPAKITPAHLTCMTDERAVMPWRPGISSGRSQAWYKRFNYPGIINALEEVAGPPLLAWDAYTRLVYEQQHYPDYSPIAAVTTYLGIDFFSYRALSAATSGGVATCTLFTAEQLGNLAYALHQIPSDSFNNNRQALQDTIYIWGIEENAGNLMMRMYDEGDHSVCKLTQAALDVTKQALTPFKILHDTKEALIDMGRAVGGALGDLVSMPLFSADDLAKDIKSTEIEKRFAELSSLDNHDSDFVNSIDTLLQPQEQTLANGLSELFSNVETQPAALQSLPQFTTNLITKEIKHGGITLIQKTNDTLLFKVGANSSVINPDFHSFLLDLSQSTAATPPQDIDTPTVDDVPKPQYYPNPDIFNKNTHANQTKTPLISDIRIGTVAAGGGSIGVIATLAGNGAISFTANQSGVFISITANFGPGFWSTMGAAVGIGTVIAGAMFTVQYFYNQHLKHIEHKLKSSLKRTQTEAQVISKSLTTLSEKLQSESDLDYSKLIKETKTLILDISKKIDDQKKRSNYAKDHGKRKVRDAHDGVAIEYQQRIEDLTKIQASLQLAQLQKRFMDNNQSRSPADLIQIAKNLTTDKKIFTDKDVARIHGLRQLIVSKVVQLSANGNTEEAQNLLKEALNLQYHMPGNFSGLLFGNTFGKLDNKTKTTIDEINTELNHINQSIGAGKNPVDAMQQLIQHSTGVLNNWKKEQSHRSDTNKRSSSKYVSKTQWDHRIQTLKTLIDTLTSQIVHYENGNQASNLKLESLSNLLVQLSDNTNQPASFWLSELGELTQGQKSLSEEESILLKAISTHHLVNGAVSRASIGEFEEAQQIMNQLVLLLPEHKALSEQYNAKLEELKPFRNQGATFWINRIKSINAVEKELRPNADSLELAIAEQFTLNEVFSQAAQGQFESAQTLLEEFKTAMPDQGENATALIAKIDELKPHYEDVDYCLQILKVSYEKAQDDRKMDDLLEQTVANNVISNDIFLSIKERELDKAKARCNEYLQAAPEKAAKIGEYQASISELELLKDETNQVLLDRFGRLSQTNAENRRERDRIISISIHAWILQNIFKLVNTGKSDEAKKDLETLTEKDSGQSKLYDRLTAVIVKGQNNAGQDEAFWQGEYKHYVDAQNSPQQTQDNEPDVYAETVNNMGQVVAAKAIFDIANRRGQFGRNREAALILERLNATNPALDLTEAKQNYTFAHREQVISALLKPVTEMATREASGWEPSIRRSVALGTMEVIKTMQIIAPNSLTWALQAAHAKCVGEMCVVQRNVATVLGQLKEDLSPSNLFNSKNYCNGLITYTQLSLIAAQYLPLERIVSEKNLLAVENMRNTIVRNGNLAARSITTTTAALQLKSAMSLKEGMFAPTSTPLLLTTLANSVIGAGYWGVEQYYKSRGQAIEDPRHYTIQNTVESVVDAIGTLAFLTVVTGSAWSLVTVGAAFFMGSNAFHNYKCNTTKKEATAKALMAAISNIEYYQNLKLIKPENKSKYRVLSAEPNEAAKQAIKEGREICFTKEGNDLFIYFKNKKGDVEQVRIEGELSCFEQLKNNDDYFISPDSEFYDGVNIFATECIINQHIMASHATIKTLLESTFNGLAYDKEQMEAVNIARLVHLFQRVKNSFEQQNYAAVIEWTNKTSKENNTVITPVYQLPPHLAWQLIVDYRLRAYAQSAENLLQFRDQYEEYSEAIYVSANHSKPWYNAHWKEVKKSLKHILRFTFQQLIVAANDANTKDEKMQYLAELTKPYKYQSEWPKLLKNDEHKFWAAFIYFSVGEIDKCKSFMDAIKDLPQLIKTQKRAEFTGHALAMLEEINAAQQQKLLLEKEQAAIKDAMQLSSIFSLLASKSFDAAKEILQNSNHFRGKQTAKAAYLFESSNQTRPLEALKQLMQEEHKDLAYWQLFYNILRKCLHSTKYAPNQSYQRYANAMLYGLIKICADHMQSFVLPHELSQETQTIIKEAMQYIEGVISHTSTSNINKQIDELLQKGHQCIRGEMGFSVISEIETILKGISYEFVEDSIKTPYLPIEMPEDSDCGFGVLGISCQKGIDLLLSHVNTQNWVSRVLFGNTQRKDVVNILLDDLEFANDTTYNRSENRFSANVQMVMDYLRIIKQHGAWIPHNQKGATVLDALALLLKKNLRIFVADSQGKLKLTSSNIHDESFETIDMLCTSTNGFTSNENNFNHYVRLVNLPMQVHEMDEDFHIIKREAPRIEYHAKEMFFKPSSLPDNKGKQQLNPTTQFTSGF